MAALSTSHHPFYKQQTQRQTSSRYNTRTLIVLSSQQQKSPEDSQGMIQKTVSRIISEVGKIRKSLKPEKPAKQVEKKGGVKDVMLMGLSFALYVYISQQMVCAYFAWLHVTLPNPSW